jgi:hypothetical protein
MANWMVVQDRRTATDRFCTLLDHDDNERSRCMREPDYAKALFKQLGEFDSIPANVKFSVLEAPQRPGDPGDETVIMALYPKGHLPNPVEPVRVWRCTYPPY